MSLSLFWIFATCGLLFFSAQSIYYHFYFSKKIIAKTGINKKTQKALVIYDVSNFICLVMLFFTFWFWGACDFSTHYTFASLSLFIGSRISSCGETYLDDYL